MMNLWCQNFGSAEIFIPSPNPTYRITLSGQLVVICTFLMDPLWLPAIGCSALTHLCIRETDLRHHVLWQTYTSGSLVLGHLIILKIDGIADQLAFWWPRRLLLLQRGSSVHSLVIDCCPSIHFSETLLKIGQQRP